MHSSLILALMVPLLVATAGPGNKEYVVIVNKCCEELQMLSADGESCVEAHWPGNFSNRRSYYRQTIIPPLDSAWVGRWLPPGLALENIRSVSCDMLIEGGVVLSVNASSLWETVALGGDLSRSTIVFLEEQRGQTIARPKPGGGHREARYCIDAALPPLGPFAMRSRTQCNDDECARRCCLGDRLRRGSEGQWSCDDRFEDLWTPNKSSLAAFDPEFPDIDVGVLCENARLLPFEEQYAEWARHSGGFNNLRFSSGLTCFGFYRNNSNGTLEEGVFYCEYSRISRGVYWLLRPLCFLSALLLTASLVSVACNKNMRRNIHGGCFASHAACLLAFNVGQIWYYITISDRLDKQNKQIIPQDIQITCKHLALTMYFVLIAAWFWLTVLCANMARGFRLHNTRFNKGSGKKFLAISAFAWGLPAVLAITCSILFTQPKWRQTPAWYTPSLMETRTCYVEPLFDEDIIGVPFMKSGTALFYYGPVCCLLMSNIICLVVTLRKVQDLKRGNSVLRRDEDQVPLDQRHKGGNNPLTAHTATANGQTPQGRNRRGTTVDAKTIKLYIKLVLLSGGIELLTEFIAWLSTHSSKHLLAIEYDDIYSRIDTDLPYRAAGYVMDFFRAAVVTWLVAPEEGYLGLIRRMLRRGMSEKKSAGAGNAGRRKHNVA